METTSFVAMSSSEVLQRRMDTISNNVANMNTTGFNRQQLLTVQHTVQPEGGDRPVAFVNDLATRTDFAQGSLEQTGNDLDVALQGDAFFTVDSPAGERYTRAGNFRLNDNNELVNADGLRVLDDQDNAIEIPDGTTNLEIDENGTILADNEEVATLGLARFADNRLLEHVSGGLYATDEPPLDVGNDDVRVQQGMLESSNVEGVREMSRMIEVHRAYERVQNVLTEDHRRMEESISTLAQVQRA